MVTASYYPISSLLSVSGHLWEVKNKENFKLLAPKVVADAYKSWSLTRGFQCIDLAEKLLWTLTRGGRNRRFDCMCRNGELQEKQKWV